MEDNNKKYTIQYFNFEATEEFKKYCKKYIKDILWRSPIDSKVKLKVVKTNGGLYAVSCELKSTFGLLLYHESSENKYMAFNQVLSKLKQHLIFFKKNNRFINIKQNKHVS